MITLNDIQGRATISVREAVELTGFGRDQVYAAIHRGEFPALRLGRAIRVPVPQLRTWLGDSPGHSEADDSTSPATAPSKLTALAKEQEHCHGDPSPAT